MSPSAFGDFRIYSIAEEVALELRENRLQARPRKRMITTLHHKIYAQLGAAENALLPADALLTAAEAATGLSVVPTPPDDPLLSGAFALLDRASEAVWMANDLAPERRRLILAHEFGHFYLHPDLRRDSCDEFDAPDSLFSRAAQIAVGYSPAERRESEANRFAAEFLLPRPALRHAFLTQNGRAAEIAARVGVPETTVLSQLAQAVLLEPGVGGRVSGVGNAAANLPVNLENPVPPVYSLDPSQKIAAETLTGPTLVDAGPGTGKTRTLIARLQFLMERRGVAPENILALTFSNRAADEMRTRLREAVGEAAGQVWIGTFHAFGLELLRKEGSAMGLPPAPGLLEAGDASRLLEQNSDRLELDAYLYLHQIAYPFPDILACISRAKDELQTPDDYRKAALALMESDAEAGMKAWEVAEIYAVYQRLLAERGLLDFGDLLLRSVELLDALPEIRRRWQAQYPHILADEYQDVNRASAELLRRLAGNGAGFWAVGDLRQAIYRFRGASPKNIRDFEQDFPGGKRLRLNVNYRSRPGIVGLFAASAAEMWETQRTAGAEPEIVLAEAEDEFAQADGIAREIRRREAAGISLRDQVLLCRSNRQAGEMAERLEARGIPAQHLGNLFERGEIKDLLALLQFACEPHGASLVRVAQFPAYDIPGGDVSLLLHIAAEAAIPFPKALSLAPEISELSEAGQRGILRLWQDLQSIAYRGDAWTFLSRYLFQTSDYLRPLLDEATFAAKQKRFAIRQFLAFVQSVCLKMRFVDGESGQREFLVYLRSLLANGEERAIRLPEDGADSDAVRLLTAHSSKGLEFLVVYLPNLIQGQFPLPNQGSMAKPPPFLDANEEPIAEEPDSDDSLFFVALSRARDALILSHPRFRKGKPTKISPLLESLLKTPQMPEIHRIEWRHDPAFPPTPDVVTETAFPDLLPRQLTFSASALEEYEKCPRRFYYGRVLNLKTGPEESDYLRFHKAIAETTQWLQAERAAGNSPTEADAQEKFAEIWPPTQEDGAAARLLRRKAAPLLETLRQNLASSPAPAAERKFTAILEHGAVTVECDAAATGLDGTLVLEKRHKRRLKADDHTDTRLALLRHAAKQQNPDRPVAVSLVSLADGEVRESPNKPKLESKRVEKYDIALQSIASGAFAANPADRECPRCPYFFLCPS